MGFSTLKNWLPLKITKFTDRHKRINWTRSLFRTISFQTKWKQKHCINGISPKPQYGSQEKMLIFYAVIFDCQRQKAWAEVRHAQLAKVITPGSFSRCRVGSCPLYVLRLYLLFLRRSRDRWPFWIAGAILQDKDREYLKSILNGIQCYFHWDQLNLLRKLIKTCKCVPWTGDPNVPYVPLAREVFKAEARGGHCHWWVAWGLTLTWIGQDLWSWFMTTT